MKGTCANCGFECEVRVIDVGVGHYEYWGATGWDSKLVVVSSCCEDDVFDDRGNVITMAELKKYEGGSL